MASTRAVVLLCSSLVASVLGNVVNRTYTNPILPGWNSDPSCTFVPEWNNTAFCTSSSFLSFPGLPVYASKDLSTWKLASNALSRPEQLPELTRDFGNQNEGTWASTIRYHDGLFYLITSFVQFENWGPIILLYTSENPYNDAAWSVPLRIENPANDIDPDLFWDDDGKVYMAVAAGIWISEVDLTTGAATEPFKVWNGTGDRNPEGPHLYKKDGYYYLLIGEGGTEPNHTATIARSIDIRGPYEGGPNNPILTAKNTDRYFQTVGHADLFQDGNGNWWAAALATRSGPEWEVYPMGRETILVSATWEEGEWPVLDQVYGEMSGPLPEPNVDIPGDGPFADGSDELDFAPGSQFPRNFLFWRPPASSSFVISPPSHPNTLQITPSRYNLSADESWNPATDPLSFIARKQTATTFLYSVDLSFTPKAAFEEAGMTVLLTQVQHLDLSIVGISDALNGTVVPHLKFHVEGSGKPTSVAPDAVTVPIETSWLEEPIRLSVKATPDQTYVFSAAPASRPEESQELGSAGADIVSGGTGPFTGTIVGSYATSNGRNGTTPAYFSRWRYQPESQEIEEGLFIPA